MKARQPGHAAGPRRAGRVWTSLQSAGAATPRAGTMHRAGNRIGSSHRLSFSNDVTPITRSLPGVRPAHDEGQLTAIVVDAFDQPMYDLRLFGRGRPIASARQGGQALDAVGVAPRGVAQAG